MKLLITLLLITQTAWAGLPPPSIQSQGGTKLNAKFDIQTPANQVTDLGGTKALIETGNINFVRNPGAEGTSPLPLAYADAAGTSPVDMTGGSPTTTCTRTTSSPLNGAGSFAMTLSTGSSHQGEGCAFDPITVPTAYGAVGSNLQFSFPYAVTGAILAGDVTVWLYDVTNSLLIQPTCPGAGLVGTSGTMYCYTTLTKATSSMRAGLFIARTSTAALTVTYDDAKLSPKGDQVTGVQATDTSKTKYTFNPNSGAFGTIVNPTYTTSQTGDKLNFDIQFTTGTTSTGTASIALPAGLQIKASEYGSSLPVVVGTVNLLSGTNSLWIAGVGAVIFYDGSDVNNLYIGYQAGSNTTITKVTGSGLFGTGTSAEIRGSVAISGWSSTQNIATSQTYNMASILANGTRVTGSAPTALGQYRSYLRNAGTLTYTETNGTPSTLPTASNGIVLWSAALSSSADASGNPSKYDIFVGKNKHVLIDFYSSTGKSGHVDVSTFYTSGADNGVNKLYDPSTGIVTVRQNCLGENTQTLGFTTDTSPITSVSSPIYFDITVSDNALPVGVQFPRSSVRLNTCSGWGSGNTAIRHFSNVDENTGTSITYAGSSVNGDSFTINQTGLYSMSFSDNAVGDIFGFSKNSSQLTTDIQSITAANALIYADITASGATANVSWTGILNAGDVIRPHDRTGQTDSIPGRCRFVITQVSN